MNGKFNGIFSGRQGMDEFSKYLFWYGASFVLLSVLMLVLSDSAVIGVLSLVMRWIGIALVIYGFVRAFSRKLDRREAENRAYLSIVAQRRAKRAAAKERYSQRHDFKFFKCPGCGTMLRVPRGKGKIHIKCKCGYTLYRKT